MSRMLFDNLFEYVQKRCFYVVFKVSNW